MGPEGPEAALYELPTSRKAGPPLDCVRPAGYWDRELSRKGLVQGTEQNHALPNDAEPAHGDDRLFDLVVHRMIPGTKILISRSCGSVSRGRTGGLCRFAPSL